MTTPHDRLAELAEDAPPGGPEPDPQATRMTTSST